MLRRPQRLPGQARLDRCREEAQFWRNYALLYRFAVPVDRAAERAARVASRIPTQRRPVDPRPTPTGAPARPVTEWGRRSTR
jgi:hypothetical protein